MANQQFGDWGKLMDSKLISDTIRRLRDAANEVVKGNYDVKIAINSSDEIGKLAESFNSVIQVIKSQQEEINKLSELRLKTELKYKNLYDNSPDLYRSVNADQVIIDCNRSYVEHLGYTKEEIIGRSVYDHIAEKSLDDFRSLSDLWKKEGRVSNKEIWLKRKNGSTFPVLLSSSGLHDIEGRLIGSNTVMKDITDIYEARKKP